MGLTRATLSSAAALLATAAVAADEPTTAAPPVADVTVVADQRAAVDRKAADEPVCRTQRSLGSRVVKRICKTAAERQKEELDARNRIRLGSGRKGQPTEAFKTPGE